MAGSFSFQQDRCNLTASASFCAPSVVPGARGYVHLSRHCIARTDVNVGHGSLLIGFELGRAID